MFSLVGAWLALMFTGRYPQGLYRFNVGVVRHITRVSAYVSPATDRYPPFAVAAPQAGYSRVKVFFRGVLAIPFLIVADAPMTVACLATIASWLVVVVTGRQPAVLQEGINLGLSYQTKVYGFFLLLTEELPLSITEGVGEPLVSSPERPLGAA